MMNDYLEIPLIPSGNGGGSFSCKANFKIDNINSFFQNVDVKIDTGCSVSTIPVRRLNVSESICNQLKHDDIDNNVNSILSYGVETGGLSHKIPKTNRQKMKCSALKFEHALEYMNLDGVDIHASNIYLNYNRSGNILIGMDIIVLMISHIDISMLTGALTLLCCPRDNINNSFLEAMKTHFGFTTII